jgi:hypothetical protein
MKTPKTFKAALADLEKAHQRALDTERSAVHVLNELLNGCLRDIRDMRQEIRELRAKVKGDK